MDDTFRALCAELAALDGHCVVDCTEEWADAMCRLRAALAQPEPEGPSMPAAISDMPEQQQRWYVLGWQAALARRGRPTITPTPVIEAPAEGPTDEELGIEP